MFKSLLKITVLLGLVCCTEPLQTATAGKIYDLPKDGVTIVLRAPTSGNPQLVKFFKGLLGETQSEILKGLRVSLPKDTPVRFIVDQVNTVLYDVKITVDEGSQQAKVSPKEPDAFPIDEARKTLNTARDNCKSDIEKEAVNVLASDVEKIGELHKALNTLLHRSEEASFYSDPVNKFANIKVATKNKVKKLLELKIGSSEEIKRYANDVIRKTRTAYANQQRVLEHLPKNASDTSNAIGAVFTQTATKLEAIEKAEWLQKDTQDRLLTNTIKYTCVFTPKEKNAKLKGTLPRVVTVIPTLDLLGIKTTIGPFVSGVVDHTYLKINEKITPGQQDQFSRSLGILVHLPLWSFNFRNFRGAPALSGGLALGNIDTTDGNLTLGPGPVALGGSLLLAGPTSNSLLSITGGAILKSVHRLNDYCVGDAYPPNPQTLTTSVNQFGWFCAVTFSYPLLDQLGFKSARAPKE